MLTPKEQRAMARTIRVLRREENRGRYAEHHGKVTTATRAGDAKDALVKYLITAKWNVSDQDAVAVLERDEGSPTEPEPAQLRPAE